MTGRSGTVDAPLADPLRAGCPRRVFRPGGRDFWPLIDDGGVPRLTRVTETRAATLSSYPPLAEFAQQANATAEVYHEAEEDRLTFWAKQANRLA